MITNYLSDKIKVLSFVAIILVLYIHSGFHDYPNEIRGMVFNHYLQMSISHLLGRCAVPLFFMISGFLFFRNVNGICDVFKKMRKRVRTLLIPYIIAALFFPVFLLMIENIPFAAKMSNGGGILNEFLKPFHEIFCNLFYKKSGGETPLAFHLWYLRDLIIIVACSPVLFYMRKFIRSEVSCLIFLLLSFADITAVQFLSFFWFMAGDAFLDRLDKIRSWWWPVVYIGLCTFELIYTEEWLEMMKVPFTSIGILAIWSTYDFVVSNNFSLKNHKHLASVCSFTFFIYLFHEPTLNIIRKLMILLLGRSSAGFAINYLVSAWIFVLLFVCVGLLFKKHLPRIYSVCVGGR